MKRSFIYTFFGLFITLSACYDDLGNYDYIPPDEPMVLGLTKDSVFQAVVGDTLHIKPVVQHRLVNSENLSYTWQIDIPREPWKLFYEGPELKTVFSEQPGTYTGMFIITDHTNDMKYFHDFKIAARTEFTNGMAVLSVESGITQLSFIRPDNTILPRLYEGMHSEQLPNNPIQLLYVNRQSLRFDYWIVCAEGEKPGVILDANTMIREKYINDNFFDTPASIKPGFLQVHPSAITMGVINGKLYTGTNQTAPFSPVYGMYGNSAAGDYELAPHFIFGYAYYIGYNTKRKQFVQFNAVGTYFGTEYTVIPMGDGFDPKNVGLDLVYMQYMNGNASYAYGKDATGKVYELKFSNVPDLFFPHYMRPFKGAHLIQENTKWAGTTQEVLFFTAGDQIYRYNPLNEEIKTLDADFSGNAVSMLKLTATGDTLITGTEGRLYYLDVSTGKNGNVLSTVEGIPGAPVDVAIRK